MNNIKNTEKIIEAVLKKFIVLKQLINRHLKSIDGLESFNDNGFNDKLEFKQRVKDSVNYKKDVCDNLLSDVKNNCQIMLSHIVFDDEESFIDDIKNFNFLGTYFDFKQLYTNAKNDTLKYVEDNKTEYKTLVIGNYSLVKCIKKCTQCYINTLEQGLEYVKQSGTEITLNK